MNREKQKQFLISAAYYGVIVIIAYFALRFIVPPLVPFLIGFLIAWILRRPTTFFKNKFHISPKLPAAVLTAVFYVLIINILVLTGSQIGSALKEFVQQLPNMLTNTLLPFINRCIDAIKEFLAQFDIAAAEQVDAWFIELTNSMTSMITSLSTSAVKLLSGIAAATPEIILRIVLTVISTFYFAIDFDRIIAFLRKITPDKLYNTFEAVKNKTFSSLKIFIRSYCLIFLMTFAELSIGFLILRVPYAVIVGLIVAILDIMPVLGTGLILLPWAVIAAVLGNIPYALGMLILYIIITVIRNIVEPRLVGQQIGLHPLATLISMFLGLQLVGIWGMFLFPVALSIILKFEHDGIIGTPSWIKSKK